MKLINVFIKLIRGGFTDRVLFVDNVPEDMFYEMKFPRKCIGEGAAQHYVDDVTQAKIPTLYPELSLSQTGDKGIIFDMENEHSKNRYLALNRYIKSVFPNNQLPAEPIVYAVDPMDSNSPILAVEKLPRVVLPTLSPSVVQTPVVGGTTASLDVEAIKKAAVEEYQAEEKKKVNERLAKAREARTIKQS